MYIANVCMVITYSRVLINQVRLPTPHVICSAGKREVTLPLFAPESLASQDGSGRPVPR